jgi:hypothetical protein
VGVTLAWHAGAGVPRIQHLFYRTAKDAGDALPSTRESRRNVAGGSCKRENSELFALTTANHKEESEPVHSGPYHSSIPRPGLRIAGAGACRMMSARVNGALLVMVAALMGIKAVGVFGSLSRAHLEHTAAVEASAGTREAAAAADERVGEIRLDDLDTRMPR